AFGKSEPAFAFGPRFRYRSIESKPIQPMSKTSLANSPSWSSVFRLLPLALLALILFAACRPSQTQPIQPASSPSPQSPSPQSTNATGPPGFPPAVLNQPYPGTGIVRIINRKEGW